MNTTLLKLNWTIDQFQSHTKPGLYIDSPYFEPSNEYHVGLRLRPYGFPGSINGVNTLIYFKSCKLSEMSVLYKFSLINSQGKHVHIKENRGIYCKDSLYGFPEYIRRTYILDRTNELLPDGKLKIYCELFISPIENEPPLPTDNKLVLDYSKMLQTSNFHDVILYIGEKEIKAHKNILSARSPVFAAMFSHDLAETRQNRVNITDVSVEVFEQLLKYIYTGQVELDAKFAADLLVASDKYGFENLKCQCEQWICSQLENDQTLSHVSSVVDLLLMADMQSAKRLKIESTKYIVRNSNLVIFTDKWSKLIQTKPKLFNEVFSLISQKLNDLNGLDNLEFE